jgi:hypothetical protein
VNYLKIGEDGRKELDYQAIEALTTSIFAKGLLDALRNRTNIFKVEIQELGGATGKQFTAFRIIIGTRSVPTFYFEITYNHNNDTYWIDHDICIHDLYKISDFVDQHKKEKAAVLGD